MSSQNPRIAGDAVSVLPRKHFTGEVTSKGRPLGTMVVDYPIYYLLSAGISVVVIIGQEAVHGGKAYLISLPAYLVDYGGFEVCPDARRASSFSEPAWSTPTVTLLRWARRSVARCAA
ncbi:hypothetical protein [Cognatilysobacter lacus]|uniref:hypothetical protein n=1 Tax=Cognatilysobacter lacus TaxID=1643323 RepID=UPI0016598EF3|nr:hypothetical protein [Lysobacter lacus]